TYHALLSHFTWTIPAAGSDGPAGRGQLFASLPAWHGGLARAHASGPGWHPDGNQARRTQAPHRQPLAHRRLGVAAGFSLRLACGWSERGFPSLRFEANSP